MTSVSTRWRLPFEGTMPPPRIMGRFALNNHRIKMNTTNIAIKNYRTRYTEFHLIMLLTIMDDWTYNLDQGKQIDVIYTDFKKAFDKVPHAGLIKN